MSDINFITNSSHSRMLLAQGFSLIEALVLLTMASALTLAVAKINGAAFFALNKSTKALTEMDDEAWSASKLGSSRCQSIQAPSGRLILRCSDRNNSRRLKTRKFILN